MSVKITDLVDQSAIDRLKELEGELAKVLQTYTNVAQELAKGLNIKVNGVNDLDKLEQLLASKGKEATQVQQQLTTVISQQQQVIANTTNTISRQLMEQERVNKTQREAYTETEKVKNLLAQVNGTYESNVRNLLRVNNAIAANKKQQDDLKKQLQLGRISLEQYNEALLQLTIKERDLKQQKADLNTLLKNEERENQAVEGSYNQLSQQLELLKKAYKSMNDYEKSSPLGKEIETTIQNLDAHLKDLAAEMGEFQRNVGNYAIANNDLKKKYEELVGTLAALQSAYAKMTEAEKASEEGKKLASSIDEVSNTAKNAKKTLEEQTKAVEEAKKSLGETSETNESVKRDLKDLVLEIANLSIAYQSLTEEEKQSAEGKELAEHIRELTEKAGVLKDAIADTNAAISNAASDTRGFDQLGGTIQLAIDGFGLAAGAAEILGISEGELAEIQTKLQAAIAASNAMTKIQNALQKQSAVMQGIANLQTKAGAIAIKLKTAAEGKGAFATKALTAAQWLFNKACTANPIGLLVVAIMACIGAVWGLVKAFEAFLGPSEDATKECEEMVEQTNNLIEMNEALIKSMERRGDSYAKVHAQIIKNLQEEYEEMKKTLDYANNNNVSGEAYERASAQYVEGFKKLQDAYLEGNDYFSKLIQQAHDENLEAEQGSYEARRKIIEREFKEYEEYANKILELGNQLGFSAASLLDWDALKKKKQRMLDEIDAEEAAAQAAANQSAADAARRAAEELRREVEKGEDALLNIIKDSLERQRSAEELSYNRKLKKLEEQLAQTAETETTKRKALNEQIRGLEAQHQQKMYEIEMSFETRRLKNQQDLLQSRLAIVTKGSEQEKKYRQDMLNVQYEQELQAINIAEHNKTITAEQAEEMRLNLLELYAIKRQEVEDEYATLAAEAVMKQYADEKAAQDAAYVNQLNALKQRYVEQMRLAAGNADQQAAIQEQFEADQAKLSEDYAIQTAQTTIDMLEAVLKTEGLTDEQRQQYMAELAKAKGDLETAMADKAIAEMEREENEDKKNKEKKLERIQKIFDYVTEALNNLNSLSGAITEARIQRLEEEQEANQEAADAESERISDLVEKKVITEEEGEARKRAAEAKTAKKNEELERKKQRLQHAQAVWDKANNAAQCAMATALGIMQLWVKPGFPQAIPLAAVVGAMGALQLATILATPIPKYAKGTKSHKGGPAIVGDGGEPELVTFAGKSWITPDSPTIVDLPAGAAVVPHISGVDETLVSIPTASTDGKTSVIVNNDYSRLEAKMDSFIYLLKLQTKQQRQIASDAALRRIADRL